MMDPQIFTLYAFNVLGMWTSNILILHLPHPYNTRQFRRHIMLGYQYRSEACLSAGERVQPEIKRRDTSGERQKHTQPVCSRFLDLTTHHSSAAGTAHDVALMQCDCWRASCSYAAQGAGVQAPPAGTL
jgi:hypothetical protein